jgi:hypothetical protein
MPDAHREFDVFPEREAQRSDGPPAEPGAAPPDVGSDPRQPSGCCASFDLREPMNPETNLSRKGWEALMVMTVIHTLIYTSYELIFFGHERTELGTDAKLIVAAWTLDILVRFRTAYRDPDTGFMIRDTWPKQIELEKQSIRASTRRQHKNATEAKYVAAGIARRYITRLFVVDVLAVVPCLYALWVAGTPDELSPFLQAGGLRLIKCCRLLDPQFRGRGRDSTVQVRKQLLFSIFKILQAIVLPNLARDKCRESTENRLLSRSGLRTTRSARRRRA